MSDSLVTLARDFFAAQDRLRGGPDPALCAADYQAWLGGSPPVPREFHEGFARAFYAAFPDLTHTVDDVFAAGDRAAVRFTLRGTHQGAFFGIPATGRAVVVVANVLLTVRNGRVSELRGIFDEAGLLRQLGVLA
jgi:ketosteroid isomerase-like protein